MYKTDGNAVECMSVMTIHVNNFFYSFLLIVMKNTIKRALRSGICLIAFFIFILGTSVSKENNNKPKAFVNPMAITDFTYWAYRAHVITVDDCQYVVYSDGKTYATMVHKHNCKYCLARQKSEDTSNVK